MVNMKNRILDHFGMKILSLIIAIIIWIIVANVDDYKTTKQISGIEIEFINGEAITEKNKVYEVPDGTMIDIVVKGRRKVVEKLTSDDFKAVADLSKMSVTNAVKVEISAVSNYVARDLTISYTSDSIVIAVEDKIEKQLPITVRTNAAVAEGFAIRNKTATPNLLIVEGAESVVNTIEEVVVDVNVKDADHSLSAYAFPLFLDKNGKEIDAAKFSYDEKEIEAFIEVLPTKELAVKVKTIGEPKEGYASAGIDYQPSSILVVGEAEDLAKVDEIVIDDIDISDCDKDLETSVHILDYLPSGIALADDTVDIMIKVMIEEVEEKKMTLRADDINIVGKREGFTYICKSGEAYTLRVRGLKGDIENLKIANLIPSINVMGYRGGTYTFTVSFKEISGIQLLDTLTLEMEIVQEE